MMAEHRQCCICGRTIEQSAVEPMPLTATHFDASQTHMWCHIDCLGERLHASVPWLSRQEWLEVAGSSA
jgi:hypothetical protein